MRVVSAFSVSCNGHNNEAIYLDHQKEGMAGVIMVINIWLISTPMNLRKRGMARVTIAFQMAQSIVLAICYQLHCELRSVNANTARHTSARCFRTSGQR